MTRRFAQELERQKKLKEKPEKKEPPKPPPPKDPGDDWTPMHGIRNPTTLPFLKWYCVNWHLTFECC